MGFMDTVSNIFGGENSGTLARLAVPALASLLNKKKGGIPAAQMADTYRQMALQAKGAGDFANTQNALYTGSYIPAAKAFAERAAGVGNTQDQMNYAGRAAGNYDQAYASRLGAIKRAFAGSPNSGAYGAVRGALESSYATGKINSMNQAMNQREMYGDTLRGQAINFLNTPPSYVASGLLYGSAGTGMANLDKYYNDLYRQEVGDTTAALRLPFEVGKENTQKGKSSAEEAAARAEIERIMRNLGY